jgi:hypothetical protein
MKNFRKITAVALATAIISLPIFTEAAPTKPVAHHKKEVTAKREATTAAVKNSGATGQLAAPADSVVAESAPALNPPIPVAPAKTKVPLPDPSASHRVSEEDEAPWDTSVTFYPFTDSSPDHRYSKLTEQDYRDVAEELGVEVAAIKAVVEIEAGKAHEGFYQPGKPIINFDVSMYRKFAPKHGVSLTAASKKSPVIFASPNTKKYGSYQAAQYARLDAARAIDSESAYESAFWGMFQIGGFNWLLCGCSSAEEFVAKMSRSERDQLELFARLITKCGMVDSLRKKQWLQFALKYNGPRAKSRGYHTRMASAYARYKANE